MKEDLSRSPGDATDWQSFGTTLHDAVLALAQATRTGSVDERLSSLLCLLLAGLRADIAVIAGLDAPANSFRIMASQGAEVRPEWLDGIGPRVIGPAGVHRWDRDAALATLDPRLGSGACVALRDAAGRMSGLLWASRPDPFQRHEPVEAMLALFGMHVGWEVERALAAQTAADSSMLEELRLREEQYRVIFEAASDGFVLRDQHLRTVDANPAFYRMYGFSPALIAAGGGYPTSFPRSYTEERDAQIRRALNGDPTHVETIALRADGQPFWVDLRVIPVRFRGEPHVLQVVRDITALREREAALHRSEARLRATVEAAFDAIIGMDESGCIIEFNRAAELCFGRRRDEVLGLPLADVIIPAQHREAHARGLAQYLAGGEGPFLGRLIETTAVRRDGSEFPAELAVSVGATPDRRIFVGHLRDITRRRAAEAQREALQAQLRQAQKMEAIGQLTGGIAHDFNNILTSVIGYVVMASERAERLQDARLIYQLEQAHQAAQRARDLVAQMLTFARRGRRERQLLGLSAVIARSLTLLRSTLPGTIELETRIDAGLPPAMIDQVQIEQVLFNLCINARDAMNGQGRLRVRVEECEAHGACASCREAVVGRWIALSVEDEGPGVPDAVRERMFEPFYTTKGVGSGSGMGLAMVHGIVHEHAGHVLVEPADAHRNPAHGARFRVLLPMAQPCIGPEPAEMNSPAPASTDRFGRFDCRLLLVEDDATVGRFMSELLVDWGATVTLCRDAIEAEGRFARDPRAFDVVLTDQAMPGRTGVDLAARLQDLRAGVPVLLYTGFDDSIDQALAQQRGVRAVLSKPVDPQRLREALRNCLR